MNKLDYPDEEDLLTIACWTYKDPPDYYHLMQYIKGLWHWDDYFTQIDDNNYELHTGGWSGNEQIISALQENTLFWTLCWEESRNGGHYKFNICELTMFFDNT